MPKSSTPSGWREFGGNLVIWLRIYLSKSWVSDWNCNAPGEIRTHGPRIRNPVLYPLSYGGTKTRQIFTTPGRRFQTYNRFQPSGGNGTLNSNYLINTCIYLVNTFSGPAFWQACRLDAGSVYRRQGMPWERASHARTAVLQFFHVLLPGRWPVSLSGGSSRTVGC